ncbi:spore germination protein, partial [Bacillus sp. JJ1127]
MNRPENRNTSPKKENIENYNLSSDLSENINQLQQMFQQAPDLVIRRFQLKNGSEAALVYLSG